MSTTPEDPRTGPPLDGFAHTIELVRAARAGDRAALSRLFELYLPRVAEMVALSLGESLARLVDAEDVVQDSMLRALRAIDSFEEMAEGTFRAYVSRIVTNCVRDAARHYGADKRGGSARVRRFGDATGEVSAESVAGEGETPSIVLRRKELSDTVERAVLELDARKRQVIGMRYVLDLSYDEIAAALGLASPSTARSIALRARMELAGILGGDPFADGDAAGERPGG